jgi:DUF1680 family protein
MDQTLHTLGALAAASAWMAGKSALPPDAAAGHADHTQAREGLRIAQVELYCGHDAAAMAVLREARQTLLRTALPRSLALASMDEAAWHIRHHALDSAQQALSDARERLA